MCCPLFVLKVGVFLVRRWLRTLPAYYVVLLILVLLALWNAQPLSGVWRYLFFLQNAAPEYTHFFGVSWNLSIEQWAYIFTPLLLCLGSTLLARVNNLSQEYRYLLLVVGTLGFFSLLRFGIAPCAPAMRDDDFRKNVYLRLNTVYSELGCDRRLV